MTQARIRVDSQRGAVTSNVVSSWAQLEAAKDNLRSTKASIKAYETALTGVRVEARIGQRTTLDVIQAQQSLLQARVDLVRAQRDHVVGSYAVASSVGILDIGKLGLDAIAYDPTIHFTQVKDKWFGLRTPDGR